MLTDNKLIMSYLRIHPRAMSVNSLIFCHLIEQYEFLTHSAVTTFHSVVCLSPLTDTYLRGQYIHNQVVNSHARKL